MLHISRSVSSGWTQLWCFHCSNLSLSKVIVKKLLVTFHYLKWPWRHKEGSLVAIFRCRVTSLPVARCLRVFRMVFVQKRRLSFFSHWMERSQNWPDLGSPRQKFRYMYFIDTVPYTNRWKIQGNQPCGVAMMSIQTFLGEVIWRDLVTCSWVTWVWNFQYMWILPFLRYLRKNLRGPAPCWWKENVHHRKLCIFIIFKCYFRLNWLECKIITNYKNICFFFSF